MNPIVVLRPSQFMNIGWYMVAPASFFVNPTLGIIATCVAVYKWIELTCWSYEMYDDQICEKKGVFKVTREYVQISRVKSVMIEEPLLMRLIDVSTVNVITSEQYKPNLILYAIQGGDVVKRWLDETVHTERNRRGVREFDMFRTN